MHGEKMKVVVIVGPTASGKTGLAIEIAKACGGEVISADSRQIYRELDIGTEKIRPEEMEGITHHLIDVIDVEETYTAVDFKRDAELAIEDIASRGKLPIVAGGTFFYIDTLLGNITAAPAAPDPELRGQLETMTTKALFGALERLDPRRAADIDRDNRRRLIRALEVVKALGHVPKSESVESPYTVLMLGITTDKQELRERIRARAKRALERGLVEETQSLLQSGVSRERLSEIGLEYRICLEYQDGNLTNEELIQKLEDKNWQYAKRQLVWLKRDKSIVWFPLTEKDKILETIWSFLSQ